MVEAGEDGVVGAFQRHRLGQKRSAGQRPVFGREGRLAANPGALVFEVESDARLVALTQCPGGLVAQAHAEPVDARRKAVQPFARRIERCLVVADERRKRVQKGAFAARPAGLEPVEADVAAEIEVEIARAAAGRGGHLVVRAKEHDREAVAIARAAVVEAQLVVPVARQDAHRAKRVGLGRDSGEDGVEVGAPRGQSDRRLLAQRRLQKERRVDEVDLEAAVNALCRAAPRVGVDDAAGGASVARPKPAGQKVDAIDELGVDDRRAAKKVEEQRDLDAVHVAAGLSWRGAANDHLAAEIGAARDAGQVVDDADGIAHGPGHRLQLLAHERPPRGLPPLALAAHHRMEVAAQSRHQVVGHRELLALLNALDATKWLVTGRKHLDGVAAGLQAHGKAAVFVGLTRKVRATAFGAVRFRRLCRRFRRRWARLNFVACLHRVLVAEPDAAQQGKGNGLAGGALNESTAQRHRKRCRLSLDLQRLCGRGRGRWPKDEAVDVFDLDRGRRAVELGRRKPKLAHGLDSRLVKAMARSRHDSGVRHRAISADIDEQHHVALAPVGHGRLWIARLNKLNQLGRPGQGWRWRRFGWRFGRFSARGRFFTFGRRGGRRRHLNRIAFWRGDWRDLARRLVALLLIARLAARGFWRDL